jgi:hypothetical protein
MALYKYVRNWVEKYSFVTKTSFMNANFKIYYMKDGKEVYKSLPFRASRDQLISTMNKIKDEIGYKETKAERDKLLKEELKEELQKQPIISI